MIWYLMVNYVLFWDMRRVMIMLVERIFFIIVIFIWIDMGFLKCVWKVKMILYGIIDICYKKIVLLYWNIIILYMIGYIYFIINVYFLVIYRIIFIYIFLVGIIFVLKVLVSFGFVFYIVVMVIGFLVFCWIKEKR